MEVFYGRSTRPIRLHMIRSRGLLLPLSPERSHVVPTPSPHIEKQTATAAARLFSPAGRRRPLCLVCLTALGKRSTMESSVMVRVAEQVELQARKNHAPHFYVMPRGCVAGTAIPEHSRSPHPAAAFVNSYISLDIASDEQGARLVRVVFNGEEAVLPGAAGPWIPLQELQRRYGAGRTCCSKG